MRSFGHPVRKSTVGGSRRRWSQMASTLDYPISALERATSSITRWSGLTFLTVVVSFWVGYSIGHGELVGPSRTVEAMICLPILWFGQPQLLLAFATTLAAWWIPLRFESVRSTLIAMVLNIATWIVIVAWTVDIMSSNKFIRWWQ